MLKKYHLIGRFPIGPITSFQRLGQSGEPRLLEKDISSSSNLSNLTTFQNIIAMAALNLALSAVCGILFSLGWWLVIHGDVWGRYFGEPACHMSWWYYFAPIISTLGLFLTNTVSAKVIESGDSSPWGAPDEKSQRVLLFTFIGIMFGGVGMATWIMAKWYLSNPSITTKYPGTALMAGTTIIASTGLLFKFSRSHENNSF